jgi:hypothetical protein
MKLLIVLTITALLVIAAEAKDKYSKIKDKERKMIIYDPV